MDHINGGGPRLLAEGRDQAGLWYFLKSYETRAEII